MFSTNILELLLSVFPNINALIFIFSPMRKLVVVINILKNTKMHNQNIY